MLAVFKREVKAYFYSPIAYVLIGFFILLTSFFFLQNLFSQSADFNGNLSTMSFFMLLIVPILTMRMLAEDRRNGTEVLLITSPVNIWGIVLGKYFATCFVFLVMTLLSLVFPLILYIYGDPATAQLIGGYVGFLLLGLAFISVGMFASSLSENQIIAAIISFVSLLTMWIIDFLASFVGGIIAKVMTWFSLFSRYEDFSAGLLSLSPIVYYITFSAVFVFLTTRVIEKRRWSQG
jgi:ABC-2 type transport system permease protein